MNYLLFLSVTIVILFFTIACAPKVARNLHQKDNFKSQDLHSLSSTTPSLLGSSVDLQMFGPIVVSSIADRIDGEVGTTSIQGDENLFYDAGTYYVVGSTSDNVYPFKSKDLKKWTYAGKLFENNYAENDTYFYLLFWDPAFLKINGEYAVGMSLVRCEKTRYFNDTNGRTNCWNDHSETRWIAFSKTGKITGPYGEPRPINEGITNLPHTNSIRDYTQNTTETGLLSIRIAGSFFEDDNGDLWSVYNYFLVGQYGYNHLAIVKLDKTTLKSSSSNLKTTSEYYDLIRSTESFYDHRTGKKLIMCIGNKNSTLNKGEDGGCVAEGGNIIKRNGKYILFYAANGWSSNTYSFYYRAANSIACLARNSNCSDTVNGIFLDGIYGSTNYTYGWGKVLEINGKYFALTTIMKKDEPEKIYRKSWLVEVEFDNLGYPKTRTPEKDWTFNPNADDYIINKTESVNGKSYYWKKGADNRWWTSYAGTWWTYAQNNWWTLTDSNTWLELDSNNVWWYYDYNDTSRWVNGSGGPWMVDINGNWWRYGIANNIYWWKLNTDGTFSALNEKVLIKGNDGRYWYLVNNENAYQAKSVVDSGRSDEGPRWVYFSSPSKLTKGWNYIAPHYIYVNGNGWFFDYLENSWFYTNNLSQMPTGKIVILDAAWWSYDGSSSDSVYIATFVWRKN